MSHRPRLLSVGALTLDTILRVEALPVTQGKYLASQALQIASGMAASAACAARRLGAETYLWASVGDDAAADALITGIEAEDVDCSLVRRVAGGSSAVSSILVDTRGERIIVPYYDPVTQAEPDGPPTIDFAKLDAVLADVRWPGASAAALNAACEAGTPAILDADVASLAVLEKLLPLATHIVASEPAAAILCGASTDPGEACAMLARRTGVFVAVTAGSAGTYWFDEGMQRVRHVPAPRVEAVDTLAAGDVFHGAFAVGLAEKMPPDAIIRFAGAAAAIKCTRFGGRLGAPTRDEVDAWLAAQG